MRGEFPCRHGAPITVLTYSDGCRGDRGRSLRARARVGARAVLVAPPWPLDIPDPTPVSLKTGGDRDVQTDIRPTGRAIQPQSSDFSAGLPGLGAPHVTAPNVVIEALIASLFVVAAGIWASMPVAQAGTPTWDRAVGYVALVAIAVTVVGDRLITFYGNFRKVNQGSVQGQLSEALERVLILEGQLKVRAQENVQYVDQIGRRDTEIKRINEERDRTIKAHDTLLAAYLGLAEQMRQSQRLTADLAQKVANSDPKPLPADPAQHGLPHTEEAIRQLPRPENPQGGAT